MVRLRIPRRLRAGWCSCIVITVLALAIEQILHDLPVEADARASYPPASCCNMEMPQYPAGYNVPDRMMLSRHSVFPMPGTPAYFGNPAAMRGWDIPLQCYPGSPYQPGCLMHHEYPVDMGYDWTMPSRQFSQVIRMRSQAFGMNTFHPIFHIIKNTQFPEKAEEICKHANRRLARITETAILNLYYQLVSEVGYDSVGAIIYSYCGLNFGEENGNPVPVIFKASSDCHITLERGDPKMKYYVIAE